MTVVALWNECATEVRDISKAWCTYKSGNDLHKFSKNHGAQAQPKGERAIAIVLVINREAHKLLVARVDARGKETALEIDPDGLVPSQRQDGEQGQAFILDLGHGEVLIQRSEVHNVAIAAGFLWLQPESTDPPCRVSDGEDSPFLQALRE